MKKILLLGSGELGKEVTIACKRLGQYVIAVDNYPNAPAMQVADSFEVIDMLDTDALEKIVKKHSPDLIVPEVESIRTEKLFDFEKAGIQVVPSAKATNYTMNRKAIRDLASKDLGLKTANYEYAKTLEELETAVEKIGIPCVIKPLMSSSGKGQSYVREFSDIKKAWDDALAGSRGDLVEVIVESFIDFEYEITLLTVTQKNGETLFCAPIGHRQERGDYMESWQPCPMKIELLQEAQEMAKKVTAQLGGAGIWGIEFFIGKDTVWFSELSPRPHDTGMVTLAGTQNLNEFELHTRAILGLPIEKIDLLKSGVSAVILAEKSGNEINKENNLTPENFPKFSGIEDALQIPNTDIKIFGKPTTRKFRRMGVAVTYADLDTDINETRKIAKQAADCVNVL